MGVRVLPRILAVIAIVALVVITIVLSLSSGFALNITEVVENGSTTATSTPEPWWPRPWEREEDREFIVSRLAEYDVYLLGNGTVAGFIREAFKQLGSEDKITYLRVGELDAWHGDKSILLVDGEWLARNLDSVDVGKLVDTAKFVLIFQVHQPELVDKLKDVLENKSVICGKEKLEELDALKKEYYSWKEELLKNPYFMVTYICIVNCDSRVNVLGPSIGLGINSVEELREDVVGQVMSEIVHIIMEGEKDCVE